MSNRILIFGMLITISFVLLSSSVLCAPAGDQVCTPGTSYSKGCNTCRCSNDGLNEFCTRNICPDTAHVQKRDAPECIPNTTFKRDCNTCSCTSTGMAVCTLKACL